MATYFHGSSENQASDSLQTIVLMNHPGYIHYSDTQPPHVTNHFFLPTNTTLIPQAQAQPLSQAPPTQIQQFVGIPIHNHTAAATHDPNRHPVLTQLDVSALHGFTPRMQMQYNQWNSADQNTAARETPRSQRGLSLTLSSQQAGVAYGSFGVDREMHSHTQCPPDDARLVSVATSSSASGVTNAVSGAQGVLLSSKYLKAAQELLDEVVNVNGEKVAAKIELAKKMGESSGIAASGDGHSNSIGGETRLKRGSELSTAEKQEIQMKKAKLINMLDEVERRYKQYQHQMMIVISSFEQAAGTGSARTYTALALQTISKQFRCLKDAIIGQIKATNKNLGEEDCLEGRIEGSRLKLVDTHLRQQRALQQLGMIQHNAWRPQRGLPERSVSVLRAWLFEHFLHPYPKDSDKHVLAKQTGLTRSQVSNWFINARVRLWKPMVEEMYLEEMKEQERSGSQDNTSKSNEGPSLQSGMGVSTTENQQRSLNSKKDNSNSPAAGSVTKASMSISPAGATARNQSGFSLIGSSELDSITQGSPKKQRNQEMLQSPHNFGGDGLDTKFDEAGDGTMTIKFGDERQSRGGYSLMAGQTNFIGGFGQYPIPIGEIGRFGAEPFTSNFSGNGVSLTLGPPPCENLSLSGTHPAFLPNQNVQLGRTLEISEPNGTSTPSFISI